MKSVFLLIEVSLVCVCLSWTHGATEASRIPESSSAQDPDTLSLFLSHVDAVVRFFDENTIDEFKILSVAQGIETKTQVYLMRENGGCRLFSPAERARAARELLSPERYSMLERACAAQLTSTREDARILAMHILAQSLASDVGKPILKKRLSEAMQILQSDDETEDVGISTEELFSIAEALAFLNDESGMPMLESALDLDSCPSSLKQRAIKAVAYRGRSLPDAILRNLFLSEDAAVAYRAFQMLGESPTNSVVLFSAIQQLDHFKRGYVEGQKLSNAVELLLLEVTSIIKNAIRQGALPQIQRERIKKTVIFLVSVENVEVQACVGSLFAEMADDGDSALIAQLLLSDSASVRSRAALALARCSPQVIRSQKDVLLGLLDDKSVEVRNFSLYALRIGLGERTGNYLTETEYKVQSARVRKTYETADFED